MCCDKIIKYSTVYIPASTHPHSHFLPTEQHAMDLLDGSVGSLLCLKVHKSIALRLTHLVLGHLARKNVPKGTEGVEEGLVVDGLVKVFDADVAHPRATKRRVTLGPHYPAWAVFNDTEVHGVKGTLSCRRRRRGRTGAIPEGCTQLCQYFSKW